MPAGLRRHLKKMARGEEILVNQARAHFTKASLEFETATISLREYQEGLVRQRSKEFQTRLALNRSDAERQAERVAWAEGMAAKGYFAQGQLLSERHTLARMRHELAKSEGEFRLFERFEVPREVHSLRTQILTAQINQRLEAERLKLEEDELAYLKKQIENCTVRAPQDGVAVYANGNRWFPRPLEPGTPVYEGQSLFLIPDLTRMEVNLSVHETMGPRVRAGMKAKVRIASRPDRVIAGTVAAIEMLSTSNWKEWDDNVRHFLVRVALDQTPPNCPCPLHVGHSRDRHRARLERTCYSGRGRLRRRSPSVVLCRHRRRPGTLAADPIRRRDPGNLRGGSPSMVSATRSTSCHDRSTWTKRSSATTFTRWTAISPAINRRPEDFPTTAGGYIPPVRRRTAVRCRLAVRCHSTEI